MSEHKPPQGEEVVIQVPKGTAHHVRIEETADEQPSQLVVRVSRNRKAAKVPVLGVIVK